MRKNLKKISKKISSPPGTLLYNGDEKNQEIKITYIEYNSDDFQIKQFKNLDELKLPQNNDKIVWINISGLHDTNLIQQIGDMFDIHQLTLEDILNTAQTPKLDDYDSYLFLILEKLNYDEKNDDILTNQIGIIIKEKYVISFFEKEEELLNILIERIKNNKGKIRKLEADYLGYSLVDVIVDDYYIALEKFGDLLEKIQLELVKDPSVETSKKIYDIKRKLIFIRHSIWPLRETLSLFTKTESTIIRKPTEIYIRDVYENIIHIIDNLELLRETASGMVDIYLSSVSNKTNEVMKLLTTIATIFIPLTFIVGIYGMNFKNMPELKFQYGYHAVMLFMFVIALLMGYYFKKKKWF